VTLRSSSSRPRSGLRRKATNHRRPAAGQPRRPRIYCDTRLPLTLSVSHCRLAPRLCYCSPRLSERASSNRDRPNSAVLVPVTAPRRAVAVARANPHASRVRPPVSLAASRAHGAGPAPASAERKTPPPHHSIPHPHPSPRKRPPRRYCVRRASRECRQSEEESPGGNREQHCSSSAGKKFWNNFSFPLAGSVRFRCSLARSLA